MLTALICNSNNLSVLPVLPADLTLLACADNQLTSLPALPAGLLQINCSNNLLSTIPVLPSGLTELTCSGNNLSALPALPSGLLALSCGSNPVGSLPSLPTGLEQLECSYNSLTGLPLLPDSLFALQCPGNQLTYIASLPESLIIFDCSYNLLQSLPELPDGLQSLNFVYNADLTCLPTLPPGLSSIGYPFAGSSFPGTLVTCMPNIPPFVSIGFPVCADSDLVGNPYGCAHSSWISGSVFLDSSENCLYETPEVNATFAKVLLIDDITGDTVGVSYSGGGDFNFFEAVPGDYTVVLDTSNTPYFVPCTDPGLDSSFTLIADQQINDIDFAVNCPGDQDLGFLAIVPVGPVFPGQLHTLNIQAGDLANVFMPTCTSNLGGTLELTVSGNVSFYEVPAGAITPTSISGNTFSYTIADFSDISFYTGFKLRFLTDTTAQAGDTICVDAFINSGVTDMNPLNDTYHFCYAAVNSYDPNIKEVYPTTVEPGYDDWLTYTIHFQNTGNAPAYNIKLKDTLSNLVRPNSFELLSYSHNVGVELNGSNATFKFDNIMLPDSASDPLGSIGHIQYRVKPLSNLPEGTVIENKAYIFFDYNSPIITNTATTSFEVDNSGMSENEKNQLTVYPNPTTGAFSFYLTDEVSENSSRVLIYNIAGEIVSEYQFSNSGLVTLDLSAEKAGIYFMTVQNGDQVTTCKLVKQ